MDDAAIGQVVSAADTLDYHAGFGNEHSSEALAGALPVGRNSPQRAPYGLYAEQLNGTAFTAPRGDNRRAWMYRIRPSVQHGAFHKIADGGIRTAPTGDAITVPAQLRWDAFAIPEKPTDFVDGLTTVATNGDSRVQVGCGIHVYLCNRSMEDRYFTNSDGELLIVPQQGRLVVRTEAGTLALNPGEICVVPRGYKFAVDVLDGPSRGYVCENYGVPLDLPERGPIGSNGLANARDFLYPVAAYDDRDVACTLILKMNGQLFEAELDRSPLDVVAWHGNHAPYKYDLERFNAVGSITYDHPDPSIFTVLTSQTDTAGTANVDFVVFPPRWQVGEDTFRPPWYHRNLMSEFMGLIHGVYDAKPKGFVPGGASLHNCMLPHGPSAEAFEGASTSNLGPAKLEDTMAFMFESRFLFELTKYGADNPAIQADYADDWATLDRNFTPDQR